MKQSQKDSFIVTTTLASTKLTQNTGLLQLLKYGSEHGVRMDPNKLRGTLMTFNKNITAQEFAKFMQDVLDALFNILMENENEAYDNQVFRTIVDTILLITDDRTKFFFFEIFKLADRMRTNEILRTEIHGRFFWWWRCLSFFRTL